MINRFNVPIVGLLLPSQPGNKNSSHLKVLPMNLSVVFRADELRNNRMRVQARTATAEVKSYNN